MTFKHTPGPWATLPPADSDSGNWEIEDGFGRTCVVFGEDTDASANAALIAAAPELLDALKALAEVAGTSPERAAAVSVLSNLGVHLYDNS
jgi:hypothetical protein